MDDKGRVHFSETKPDNEKTSDLSQEIENSGNFLNYPEPVEIVTPSLETQEPLSIKVRIILVDYELSDSSKQTIRANIKAIYRAFQQWFGWPPQAQHPITVRIFGNIPAFEEYQMKKSGRVNYRDHYSSRHREIVMKGTVFEDGTLNTLYHEASHAIMHMYQNGTSKWLNEGLAEVFADTRSVRHGLPNLGIDAQWVAVSKLMLQEGSLKSAGYYLSLPNSEWTSEGKRLERSYYMIAWTLMRFLTSNQQGRDTLKTLFQLNKTQSLHGKNLANSLGENYPGGITALDKNWRQWINKQ